MVAAAIATLPFLSNGSFLRHWLLSWLFSWTVMLPVVLLAAPKIRELTQFLTREESREPTSPM